MIDKVNTNRVTKITAADALKRYTSLPSCTLIAPSGSGKTTLTNAVINKKIAQVLAVGIGEKNQTTLISTDYVLDSRIINEEQFALIISIKPFEAKKVLIVLREKLLNVFIENDCDSNDTIDCMDESWFVSVLEPEDASYHLNWLKNQINIEELKKAVLLIISDIEEVDGKSFDELVKERKKQLKSQGLKMKQIRLDVFEELWDKQDEKNKKYIDKWFDELENVLLNDLIKLTNTELKQSDNVLLLENTQLDENTSEMLKKLYDPNSPYSLIIREIKIACSPNEEIVKIYPDDRPFRFSLRDTMGLTQTGTDDEAIRSALEIGMNYHSNSILILFSLEERNDVLKKSCSLISEKIDKAIKYGIPIYVVFTKADKIIETKITLNKEGLVLKQDDFNNKIFSTIKELNEEVEKIASSIPRCKSRWLSLRYLESDMDPIQMALKEESEYTVRFKPKGLYQFINEMVNEIQEYLLPKGLSNPIFITTNNPNLPPVTISLNREKIKHILDNIQFSLTQDKVNVNGYIITTTHTIHGRSVVTYWDKLQVGLGHSTKASIYGNFSINMKGLLNKVLSKSLKSMDEFYGNNAVSTLVDNISEQEVDRLLELLGVSSELENKAFDGWNPDVIIKTDSKNKKAQLLHFRLQEYFNDTTRYYSIIDRVAFQLSFGNKKISDLLVKAYNEKYNYDFSIRNVQKCFLNIFGSEEFRQIIVDEFINVMTDTLNKMFVAI